MEIKLSEVTVRLILLVLPGVISALIIERLTVHKEWSVFRFVLYSIMLGISSYLLTEFWHSDQLVDFWTTITNDKTPLKLANILWTCVTAIPLAFFLTAIIQYKVLNRIAKRLHVSDKYGEDNLFTHFLNFKEVQWIIIRDKKEKLTYTGAVEFFNETNLLREILLSDATVYDTENTATPLYNTPYIYLSFSPDQIIIEIPPKQEDKNAN